MKTPNETFIKVFFSLHPDQIRTVEMNPDCLVSDSEVSPNLPGPIMIPFPWTRHLKQYGTGTRPSSLKEVTSVHPPMTGVETEPGIPLVGYPDWLSGLVCLLRMSS